MGLIHPADNLSRSSILPCAVGLLLLVAVLGGCGPADKPKETQETAQLFPAASPALSDNSEVMLERNDWSTIWIENANQSSLPRLLFVGDSITEGYYSRVKDRLGDNYYFGRYTTSKFIGNPDFQTELTTVLNRYEFEIIHLNNGLHGWDYPLEAYQTGLEELLLILDEYAPQATLIWCQTTPVRLEENLELLSPLNQDVIQRNQIAEQVLGGNGVSILDLYQEMLPHPEYYRTDGLHFNDNGRAAQAELIAEFIRQQR